MKTKYYEAMSVASGYRGRIYQYKDDQERTEVVWLSPETYPTEAQRQIKIDELTTTTKKARELAQNQLSKARFDLDMASRHLNRTRDRMFILAIEKGISLG